MLSQEKVELFLLRSVKATLEQRHYERLLRVIASDAKLSRSLTVFRTGIATASFRLPRDDQCWDHREREFFFMVIARNEVPKQSQGPGWRTSRLAMIPLSDIKHALFL